MLKLLYKSYLKLPESTIIHIFCWFVFISYEVALTIIFLENTKPFILYFLFYVLNISLFYFHSLIVLKRLYTNTLTDIWRIPLLIILELILYFFISYLIVFVLSKFQYAVLKLPDIDKKYIALSVWRGIYFILYGTGYYFLMRYTQKKEKTLTQAVENEKLKNDLLRAEQDFLRAQINPHLLFNTLSFIKYAARKKPDEADEAVIRLSGIMGFALDNNSQTILLVTEMEQVENIIGLNQLRYNHTLNVNYTTQIENPQATIIPIILLTLVENVFKHGNLLEKEQPAIIRVVSTNEYVLLQTSNLPGHNSHTRSTYTGLTNINSRLKQFYKNNHEFNYGMNEDLFKVEIKINLQTT